jgi:hypothetical protein
MLLFPTGAWGVLYPPGSLSEEVANEMVFMEICPTADDIWLKAMSALKGTPVRKVAPRHRHLHTIEGTRERTLRDINVGQNKNDEQIRSVFGKYDIYSRID